MIRKLLLVAFFALCAGPALAQNVQCTTRPFGDSTNACASTKFVQGAVGTLPSIGTSTVLGNFSGTTTAPSAQTVPTCASDGSSALTNPAGGGFACTAIVPTSSNTYWSATLAAATAANIPATYTRVNLTGYHAANDAGYGATYARVNCTSTVAWGFLSADAKGANGATCTVGQINWLLSNTTAQPGYFGAYGDGSHDDSTALTNAVSYASTYKYPLCITSGQTFGLASAVALLSNTTLTCNGTIEVQTGIGTAAYNAFLTVAAGIADVTIDGPQFDGTNLPAPTGDWVGTGIPPGSAIYVAGTAGSPAKNIKIENISFSNFPSGPIFASHYYNLTVTNTRSTNVQNSAPSATFTITNVTQANPAVVTVASATGLTNGDQITIANVVGMTQLNGNTYTVSGLVGNSFNLQTRAGVNVNSTGYGAYISGGNVYERYWVTNGVIETYASTGKTLISKNLVEGFQWKFINLGNTSGYTISDNEATGYNNAQTGNLEGQAAYHDQGGSDGVWVNNIAVGTFGLKAYDAARISVTNLAVDSPIIGGILFDGCIDCHAVNYHIVDPTSPVGAGSYCVGVSSQSGFSGNDDSFSHGSCRRSALPTIAQQSCMLIANSTSNTLNHIVYANNYCENYYNAVYTSTPGSGAVISDVEILNNSFTGNVASINSLTLFGSSIKVIGNKFADTAASLGIYAATPSGVAGTLLEISNNTFQLTAGASAISLNSTGANLEFDVVRIKDNLAEDGSQFIGVSYNSNTTDYIKNLDISGNTGYNQTTSSAISITANTTTANTILNVQMNSVAKPGAVNNITFTNGSSLAGGVLYNNHATISGTVAASVLQANNG